MAPLRGNIFAGKVTGLDIDFSTNKLYWATDKFGSNPYKIQKADLEGSNLETLAEFSPFDNFTPFGLELGNNNITKTEETGIDQSIAAYPNPCSDFIIIDFQQPQREIKTAARLKIINSNGKIYKSEKIQTFPYILNTVDWPANNYFLELLVDGRPEKTIQISKGEK